MWLFQRISSAEGDAVAHGLSETAQVVNGFVTLLCRAHCAGLARVEKMPRFVMTGRTFDVHNTERTCRRGHVWVCRVLAKARPMRTASLWRKLNCPCCCTIKQS